MPHILGERYQIEELLSEGVTSSVYKAVDLHLRRSVAVRRLKPHLAGDPELVQRFLDEARLAASHTHPNIVSTFDVGTEDRVPYAVTEYSDGDRLSDLIRDSAPLRSDRVRTIGAQLVSALDYAQRHDGVDYGLSAEDVEVALGDRAMVLAFQEADRNATEAIRRDEGFSTGTPRSEYPGTSGRMVEATGVAAIGILLYQMATGRHPFRADDDDPRYAMRNRVVSPAALNPSISAQLERTILGALETGPQRRYRSLSDLGLSLQLQESQTMGRIPREGYAAPVQSEQTVVVDRYRSSGAGWPSVLLPTLLLAFVLVGAVAAAVVVRPRLEVPSVAGLISGVDMSSARDTRNAQLQAADLDKAITTVRGNTQKVNSILSGMRDRLSAEMSIVDGMRTLVDEMKKDATTPIPNQLPTLAAKRQSFELSYSSFQAARTTLASNITDAESRLNDMDADSQRARTAANQLQTTLAGLPVDVTVQPKPGDETGPVAEYNTAAQSARNEIASAKKTDSDLVNAVNLLRQQASDAAALKVAPPPGAQTPTPMPAAASVPGATATPGATPGQVQTPGPATTPVPTATAKPLTLPARPEVRPTAPAAPPSSPRYSISGRFSALAGQIAPVVGSALENERVDQKTGDVYQQTTGGMLVWRRATNLAYFTDGFVTWVIGPNGLQERSNGEAFDWEKALENRQ